MTQTLLQVGGAAEDKLDIFKLILEASPVVKGVLMLLILMSVASWYVIGSKSIYLSRALGRKRRPVFFCSRMWADQPATREQANIAGASGGGISATSSTTAE